MRASNQDIYDRIHELEAAPFRVETLPDVLTIETRTEWLVTDLIPRGAITLLTGDSGVGKSTLALAIAGSVAQGRNFLGRPTIQVHALYADGENPVHVVKEPLERLRIDARGALHVWGGWNTTPVAGPDSAAVIEFARERQGLIVYDSLIQFHSGSEQDSSETRRYIGHYRHLANQGAAVLLLHHTGKGENAKQYRGSSDIKAAVDQAFCIEAIGEADTSKELRLTPFKSRIGHVSPVRIRWNENGFCLSESLIKTNREIIEQIISKNPGLSSGEIVSLGHAGGVAKNKAEALLISGARDGWLNVEVGSRNRKTYMLTPASEQESGHPFESID